MFTPESLDGVIQRAGEDRFALHRDPVSLRVWIEAVGARIADRARPITLERGVLTIRAATSVWASELSLLGDTLLARLRAGGVPVRELRFRVGPIEPPARPPERRTTRRIPPPAPLEGELADAVARVEDDELRAVITAAASANLAWQAHVTGVSGAHEGAPVRATLGRREEISAAPPAARAPRDAERGSAPPARTSPGARGAGRGTPEGG